MRPRREVRVRENPAGLAGIDLVHRAIADDMRELAGELAVGFERRSGGRRMAGIAGGKRLPVLGVGNLSHQPHVR